MKATIRPFRAQDLGLVLRIWEEPAPLSAGDGLTVERFREVAETYARY